jgi:hypothetical protein
VSGTNGRREKLTAAQEEVKTEGRCEEVAEKGGWAETEGVLKLLAELLRVSIELTELGRKVARFDAGNYGPGDEDELRRVDTRLEQVKNDLAQCDSADKFGGTVGYRIQLRGLLKDIDYEWRVASECCWDGGPEVGEPDEENPSKRELADAGGFPYIGSVYDSDCG